MNYIQPCLQQGFIISCCSGVKFNIHCFEWKLKEVNYRLVGTPTNPKHRMLLINLTSRDTELSNLQKSLSNATC